MRDDAAHRARRGSTWTRRHGLTALAAWVVGVATASPAAARTAGGPRSALDAYADGRWHDAARLGRQDGSADGLALAARALLAEILIEGPARTSVRSIEEPRRLAEAALRLDPAHVEGRLQLATALGLLARRVSPPAALASRLPQRTRALLLGVTRDAPEEAWGFALLGGWHLEALRQGGQAARTFLGADLETGRAAFLRAQRLDPDEPAIPFYCASSLLALAHAVHGREAGELLARLDRTADDDAFRRQIRRRGRQLADTLARDGSEAAARLAKAWL